MSFIAHSSVDTSHAIENILPLLSADAPKLKSARLNIDEVRSMLARFGISDDLATFAVLKRGADGKKIARKTLVGLSPENVAQLRQWHDIEGFGISVMLQRMDGLGRKRENIISWRVVSLDSKRGQAVPLQWPGGILPTEVVQSREGSWHAHWVLSAEVDPERGIDIAKAIAGQLDGDVAACLVTQPWRVVGSHHHEQPRDQCRVLSRSGNIATAEALEAAYASRLPKAVPALMSRPAPAAGPAHSVLAKFDYILANCTFITSGRPIWIAIGQAIYSATGGDEDGFLRWHEVSMQSPGYLNEKDCRTEWNTFGRGKSRHANFATITHHARECGLDLSAFGRAFPSQDRKQRQRRLEPTLSLGGYATISNARFGAKRYLDLSLTARHEHLLLRALQPHKGDALHTKAASEALTGTRANTARDAVGRLAGHGLLSVIQEPTNNSPGRYRLSAIEWCQEPRGPKVRALRGNLVDARPLNGFTLLPNTMWSSLAWRIAGDAGREVALLAFALAGDCRSERTFEISWNMIEVHTGICQDIGKALGVLCRLGILQCVRKGESTGAVGLYKVGPWLRGMDELNTSQ